MSKKIILKKYGDNQIHNESKMVFGKNKLVIGRDDGGTFIPLDSEAIEVCKKNSWKWDESLLEEESEEVEEEEVEEDSGEAGDETKDVSTPVTTPKSTPRKNEGSPPPSDDNKDVANFLDDFLSRLKTTVDDAKNALSSMRGENTSLKAEVALAKDELEKARKEILVLTEKNIKLKKAVEALS